MSSVSRVIIALLMMTPELRFRPIHTGIAWRKFEYRNLAKLSFNEESYAHEKICMSNETYAQICTKVRKEADKVSTNVALTACIGENQNATILELSPEDP